MQLSFSRSFSVDFYSVYTVLCIVLVSTLLSHPLAGGEVSSIGFFHLLVLFDLNLSLQTSLCAKESSLCSLASLICIISHILNYTKIAINCIKLICSKPLK